MNVQAKAWDVLVLWFLGKGDITRPG